MYLPGAGALTGVLLFLQLIRPVASVRTRFQFQVIDAHFAFPDGIAAALLSLVYRVPFCVTMRGCELLHSQFRIRRRVMAWALKRAAVVITVSAQLRQLASELGVAPEKIKVIANGVDSRVFYPRGSRVQWADFGLSNTRKTILAAGHLIELKGHHRTIQAVKRINDEQLPVQLVIVGDPPSRGVKSYESRLRQLIADLQLEGHVAMIHQVPQDVLAQLMSAADVFCMASAREGWPNVVHEAMGCGTPVVATNVGAVAELLDSSEVGSIVPSNDVTALAAALKKALTLPWDRPAISARAHSRSWGQVAAEVHAQLLRAVKPKARNDSVSVVSRNHCRDQACGSKSVNSLE
jgi:glycosyltransferase involved in cell wall biosynthesis